MVRGRLVIVGASLAGLRAAEAARAAGFDGPMTLIGAESHLPYDRPPLSKEFLKNALDAEAIALCERTRITELELDLWLGTRARAIDLERRRIELDGEELEWGGLVVATGCVPRSLPEASELEGVFVLRSVDDALVLRSALAAGPRVVVVGAGFIGGEVAASARALGLEVTIVEALPAPLEGAIGSTMASVYRRLHDENGIRLRLGFGVDRLEGNCRVEAVTLADGSRLEADVVVVGIGVRPAVDWLASSGLALDDGVVCDGTLQAARDVYAAGDVARWLNPRYGCSMRVEHWTNAADQGAHAARNLVTGAGIPYEPVPYFWSDQHGCRLQFAGTVTADILALGAADEGVRCVGLYGRAGVLTGALVVDAPALFARLRTLLLREAAVEEAARTVRQAGFVVSLER